MDDIVLVEFADCADLDLVPLNEAGGVISWIKRTLSGSDQGVVSELGSLAARIETKEEKATLLRELDEFINEAEASERDGTFGDLLRSIGLSSIGGLAGSVFGAAVGSIEASKMVAPVVKKLPWWKGGATATAMHQNVANAAHKATQFGTVVDKTLTGLTTGAIAAGMIVLVCRTVNRYSGGMKDYVQALHALRDEVRKLKVK